MPRNVQVPFWSAVSRTDCALKVPDALLVPLTVTHPPTMTSDAGMLKVAVMNVFAFTITVVWPELGFWTSSVPPLMLAIVPVAAGAKAAPDPGRAPGAVEDGELPPLDEVLGAVVAVVDETAFVPPHAADAREITRAAVPIFVRDLKDRPRASTAGFTGRAS
ncbi:MAG TPA: hypothetical protein VFN61_06535 [Acidimicrobiales bacterium]|nr:hypothetical protein [Acidimicrobiales bacterium]